VSNDDDTGLKERAMPNEERTPSPGPLSLAAVAAQLRDGPLERCVALHRQAAALACPSSDADSELAALTTILDLTLEASEQFHAFHRDLRTFVRRLADEGLARQVH
jgi:hypothetical protein